MIHLCASLLLLPPSLSPALPSDPSPSLPPGWRAHTRARTAHAVHLPLLQCHGAISFEFSLSGSVGPFASLMIALHAV